MRAPSTLSEIAYTDLMEGEECEGCNEPAVVMDVNLIPLCQACADGCRIEDCDA